MIKNITEHIKHQKRAHYHRASKFKRSSDIVFNFWRLISRMINGLSLYFTSSAFLNAIKLLPWFSALIGILDNSVKACLELLISNLEGPAYAYKVFVLLSCVGLAITSFFYLSLAPFFAAASMLLILTDKILDVGLSIKEQPAEKLSSQKLLAIPDLNFKLHDLANTLIAFAGMVLMITCAPQLGETILLVTTLTQLIHAAGLNPLTAKISEENLQHCKIKPPEIPPPLTNIQTRATKLNTHKYTAISLSKFKLFNTEANRSSAHHTPKRQLHRLTL